MFRRLRARRGIVLAVLCGGTWPLAVLSQPPATPEPLLPRDWTQVRIEIDGVSLVLARLQAQHLADLALRALAAPAAPAPATGPPIAQFEFGRGADAAGVLSLHGERWRWAAAGGVRTLQVDPALSQALLQEAQRLLHR